MKLFSWPLHVQILIALIIGTVAGTLINPSDVALDDGAQFVITLEDDGRVTLLESDATGRTLYTQQFATQAKFDSQFPELKRRLVDQESGPGPVDAVEDRRVHIVEDGKSITLSYSRTFGKQPVISQYKAGNAVEFQSKFPEWSDIYATHGGGWRRKVTVLARAVGDLFLRMLKMITIPLIATSLISGVAGLGNASNFGSMFSKTLLYYFVTSMLAITTGLVVVNLLQPGIGASLPGGGEVVAGANQSLPSVFHGMLQKLIPVNPIAAFAEGDFLSIISFSILLGIFIIYVGGRAGEVLTEFFNAAFQVMMRMTLAIIRLAPLGVLAFMLFATATQGLEIFKTLAWYMLSVFAALVVHAIIVLPLILKFVAKRSPIQFAQAMSPALMTAFSTASSNATLPLTLTSVEQRAGVSNKVSSFVLPLGATINMDGTALYEAVAVLFIAQATPGFDLTLGAQISVALTALLASVGAAGIPHAGLVMMAIVLQAVGLPLEAQGVIIAVDRVLDMCRTTVNVWSDSCGCAVLDRMTEQDAD
jgi:Na+/H+-dicarboxylate symporter